MGGPQSSGGAPGGPRRLGPPLEPLGGGGPVYSKIFRIKYPGAPGAPFWGGPHGAPWGPPGPPQKGGPQRSKSRGPQGPQDFCSPLNICAAGENFKILHILF